MSDPRHRLEPTPASDDLGPYPPPTAIPDVDIDAVARKRMSATPALYIPPRATHVPSGAGPDQWAEGSTPESEDLEFAHS